MVCSQLSVTSAPPSPQNAFQHNLTTNQDPCKHWDPASSLETRNQEVRHHSVLWTVSRGDNMWRKINMQWLICNSVPLSKRCMNFFYHLWRCFHVIVIEQKLCYYYNWYFFCFASSCKKRRSTGQLIRNSKSFLFLLTFGSWQVFLTFWTLHTQTIALS